MPISAPGNRSGGCASSAAPRGRLRHPRQRGFTLIELVVVLAIIAIGAALVSLAIRDPASTRLEADAARLVALLEIARSEARAGGLDAVWAPQAAAAQATAPQPSDSGAFQFVGLPPSLNLPTHWLDERVSAVVVGGTAVRLGPEAILPAQRVVLQLESQRLDIATDGLAAFAVVPPLTDAGR